MSTGLDLLPVVRRSSELVMGQSSATKGIPTRHVESGLSTLPMDRHRLSCLSVFARVTQILWLGCGTNQLKACDMAKSVQAAMRTALT